MRGQSSLSYMESLVVFVQQLKVKCLGAADESPLVSDQLHPQTPHIFNVHPGHRVQCVVSRCHEVTLILGHLDGVQPLSHRDEHGVVQLFTRRWGLWKTLNILYQRQEAAGIADKFIQKCYNVDKFGPMTPLLLPTVQHELVQSHGAAQGRRESVALFNGQNHILIGHLPIWPLPV